ncbi:HET-domain-containing protein [Pyrenochaeta sp. DS3sAY3a]|nr:HET-domain-containing protein [Pyrenochaeta sp. DS3sAY3a]
MNQYKYIPLNGSRKIRLLHLLEEPTNDSITARLEEVQLEENPKYCALSYVWGTEDPAQSLRFGEQHIMIRKSLFQALKRIWKMGARIVWADAVCINQSDLDERAQQVMIMRQIYESAAYVIVHLGETSDAAQLQVLFPTLMKLVEGQGLQLPLNTNARLALWPDLQKQYGLPDPDHDVWKTLVDLANHAWFRRAWTLQEILVARKCIFVRGDWSRSSTVVVIIFQVLYYLGLSEYIDRVTKMGPSPIDLAGLRCASVVRRQTRYFKNREISIKWQPSPLIQLLRESQTSQCSNPQDLIYALLGVSHETDEEDLKPSYDETVDQTFIRVARVFLKRGYGPQLLENTSCEVSPTTLPSWIPRWGNSGRFRVIHPVLDLNFVYDSTSTAPQFNASLNTKQAFHLDKTETILIGQGVIFDTIKSIGSSELLVTSLDDMSTRGMDGTAYEAGPIVKYVTKILQMLPESLLEDVVGVDEKDVEKLFSTICDIATCERLLGREAPQSVWKGLGTFLRLTYHTLDPFEMGLGFLLLYMMTHSIEDTTENRKLADDFYRSTLKIWPTILLCVTEKGHVGQVPQFAQVGDKIVLLKGCEVPYLLREVENRRYKVVSNCYLHGVMHGEAWPRSSTDVHEIWIV